MNNRGDSLNLQSSHNYETLTKRLSSWWTCWLCHVSLPLQVFRTQLGHEARSFHTGKQLKPKKLAFRCQACTIKTMSDSSPPHNYSIHNYWHWSRQWQASLLCTVILFANCSSILSLELLITHVEPTAALHGMYTHIKKECELIGTFCQTSHRRHSGPHQPRTVVLWTLDRQAHQKHHQLICWKSRAVKVEGMLY